MEWAAYSLPVPPKHRTGMLRFDYRIMKALCSLWFCEREAGRTREPGAVTQAQPLGPPVAALHPILE